MALHDGHPHGQCQRATAEGARERGRTVLGRVPVARDGELAVQAALGLGLVVDRVEADDALQEDV